MEDSNIAIDKDVHFVLWVSVVKSIHESELADGEIHIQPPPPPTLVKARIRTILPPPSLSTFYSKLRQLW